MPGVVTFSILVLVFNYKPEDYVIDQGNVIAMHKKVNTYLKVEFIVTLDK